MNLHVEIFHGDPSTVLQKVQKDNPFPHPAEKQMLFEIFSHVKTSFIDKNSFSEF